MRLGDGGNAPQLNYNLPQNTAYRANGFFLLDEIPASVFDPIYQNLHPDNPWDWGGQHDVETIAKALRSQLLKAHLHVSLFYFYGMR